ncbi:hypothetical protein [Tengunoibacter tsumagoiensis]|uniref:TIR domain-containing protein n=1 Tax=Tengunoibacter tsumagoiensis TaxID=2014871 RepID=A0A401ZUR6_9CHLR|nr:hypothetical protein [Tengunoibacter tsumagoiensis]GCE10542.1 hypothetical protein KTT_04010 [Tengunoibacter tsumagoiensis]
MNVPRVFVSYYPPREPNLEQQLVQQLIADLRAAGAEVIVDGGRDTDEEFFQFIARELPTCQWVFFVQTLETLQAPRTRMLFSAGLKLKDQQGLQGLLRIIPSATETVPAPPEWADLTTYNLGQDYPKVLERLLFTLTQGSTGELSVNEIAPATPALPIKRVSHFSSPPPSYDRPLAPPPRLLKFKDMQYAISQRTKWILLVTISSLAIFVLIFSIVYNLLHQPQSPNPVVGYAYFTSSELFDDSGTKGVCDGITVILNNLNPPSSSNNYYAWLLPDNAHSEANVLSIGTLTYKNGIAQLTYSSPVHDNLLNHSRLLVTEESNTVTPSNPSPDKGTWRFTAEIPQSANSSMDMSGNNASMDMSSATQIDHMRHLLYGDPVLKKLNLQGGSTYWFRRNTMHIMQLAKDSRDTPNYSQTNAVKILDYIDGSQYVQPDVPQGTPLLADPHASQVGLLTRDQEHAQPQGYVNYLGVHLNGLINTPGTTNDERKQVFQINSALSQTEAQLNTIRQDAIKLANRTDDSNTLNDLYANSMNMYYGAFDPVSGNRQGGAIWIYDHIQHLALFTVTKYGA